MLWLVLCQQQDQVSMSAPCRPPDPLARRGTTGAASAAQTQALASYNQGRAGSTLSGCPHVPVKGSATAPPVGIADGNSPPTSAKVKCGRPLSSEEDGLWHWVPPSTEVAIPRLANREPALSYRFRAVFKGEQGRMDGFPAKVWKSANLPNSQITWGWKLPTHLEGIADIWYQQEEGQGIFFPIPSCARPSLTGFSCLGSSRSSRGQNCKGWEWVPTNV